MTPDLNYLALSSALCLVLWIPYIVVRIRTHGANPDDYRQLPQQDSTDFLKRANRAHVNLVENLPVFAALVLIAHVSDEASSATAIAAAVFFWARVVHAIVFWFGWPYVRTLAFAVSWLANLYLAWAVLF